MAIDNFRESYLRKKYPEAFEILLFDQTTHKNIFWATNDYIDEGKGFEYNDQITMDKVSGNHIELITPRALKNKDIQAQRAKNMAEVFTPSWVCNKQNNLVDENWFGYKNVFNIELDKGGSISGKQIMRKLFFLKTRHGKIIYEIQDLKCHVGKPHI